MNEHYFSPTPDGAPDRRTVTLTLAGRRLEVLTSGGVFSADRLDLGTEVLLRRVPAPPSCGDLLDLGCGWGPIALSMAMLAPGARVWAVDVNERARGLTAENARRLGLVNIVVAAPEEVPAEVTFAAVWSNPPIRIGKAALHALLLDWLGRLDAGACAHLVVQRHLGADSLHAWLAAMLADRVGAEAAPTVDRVGSAKGYRVLRVCR